MKDRITAAISPFVARRFDEIGDTATASAVQAWVATDRGVTFDGSMGVAQFDPARPFTADTPMDLASVTKVFTATLAKIAVDRGLVEFDTPAPDLGEATLLQLMNHSSGLPAWDKFYERLPMNPTPEIAAETRAQVLSEIIASDRKEPGVVGVYSDLGYIYLGIWLERLFDRPLEELVEQLIAQPLGLASIRYVSLARADAPIAEAPATEVDPRRGGPVVGTVHDENCHIIGGVAGHAGLFGTARDVGAFGAHLLSIDRGASGIVQRETLQFCWSERSRGGDGHHLGGWDTPSGESSSAGRGFAPGATVGHLGFTGTSIWIERNRGFVSVLQTNRVYPTRENPMIKPLRIAFGEAVIPPADTAE